MTFGQLQSYIGFLDAFTDAFKTTQKKKLSSKVRTYIFIGES